MFPSPFGTRRDEGRPGRGGHPGTGLRPSPLEGARVPPTADRRLFGRAGKFPTPGCALPWGTELCDPHPNRPKKALNSLRFPSVWKKTLATAYGLFPGVQSPPRPDARGGARASTEPLDSGSSWVQGLPRVLEDFSMRRGDKSMSPPVWGSTARGLVFHAQPRASTRVRALGAWKGQKKAPYSTLSEKP